MRVDLPLPELRHQHAGSSVANGGGVERGEPGCFPVREEDDGVHQPLDDLVETGCAKHHDIVGSELECVLRARDLESPSPVGIAAYLEMDEGGRDRGLDFGVGEANAERCVGDLVAAPRAAFSGQPFIAPAAQDVLKSRSARTGSMP